MVQYFLASFIGYSAGRIGHIVGGSVVWIPHHWIFGLIIMIAPLFLKSFSKKVRILILLLGIGVFVSDFKDFTRLETFSPDDVTVVRFWGID